MFLLLTAAAASTPQDYGGGGVAGFDAVYPRTPCVVSERQRVVRATVGSNDVSGVGAALVRAGEAPAEASPEKAPIKRYDVASVSFQRVETPFIIGLWIFCASLAKIGEFVYLFCVGTCWPNFYTIGG